MEDGLSVFKLLTVKAGAMETFFARLWGVNLTLGEALSN